MIIQFKTDGKNNNDLRRLYKDLIEELSDDKEITLYLDNEKDDGSFDLVIGKELKRIAIANAIAYGYSNEDISISIDKFKSTFYHIFRLKQNPDIVIVSIYDTNNKAIYIYRFCRGDENKYKLLLSDIDEDFYKGDSNVFDDKFILINYNGITFTLGRYNIKLNPHIFDNEFSKIIVSNVLHVEPTDAVKETLEEISKNL